MSRLTNVTLVAMCWVAIYLPSLGSLEIKGEEGRRILPAVTMLETGNYLVPQVGSEPYFRKPPMVNWLVAASFKATGHRNEWTARLPSVLCVLAVALAFITIARTSLGANGSLIAALVWLTNFGILEKGRLIEIEALYVSLFGLALICWMSSWQQRRPAWLTWTVPWIFLGLGLLAKGPLNLFFFYAVVIAVLYQHGELRKLWQPAHLVGLLVMLGIFAAWAIPYLQVMPGAHAAENWSTQITGRLGGGDFKFGSWLFNIPRAVAYFLPWALLLPFAYRARFATEAQLKTARALCWGIAIPFFAINLLPSGLPRYAMPALIPGCWLLAMVLSAENIRWPWRPNEQLPSQAQRLRLVLATAAIITISMCLYSFLAVPFLARRQKVKNIAAQINAVIPPNERLYAIDPDYQPFLFYVRAPIAYVSHLRDLPPETHYLLVQPDREGEAEESVQWQPLRARPVLRLTDYRKKTVILLKLSDGSSM